MMSVRPSGRIRLSSEEHPMKALEPIAFRVEGSDTETSRSQFWKALLPMRVTPSGITAAVQPFPMTQLYSERSFRSPASSYS